MMERIRRSFRRAAQPHVAAPVAALAILGATFGTSYVNIPQDVRPRYVALGDSYSSGNGTTGATGDCRRSPRAYGPLLAESLDAAEFTHAACSGATTDDVRGEQLQAVASTTTLVTLTIGGNDGDMFTTTVTACAALPLSPLCGQAVKRATSYASATLPGRLDKLYRDLAARLPEGATVLVGGYPEPYEAKPRKGACGTLGPSTANRAGMNQVARSINTTVARAVWRAEKYFPQKWKYVPVSFAGHELCSSWPWVHGAEVLIKDVKAAWHPKDEGHGEYLERFTAAAK